MTVFLTDNSCSRICQNSSVRPVGRYCSIAMTFQMSLLCFISVTRLFIQPPMSARMVSLCGLLTLHSAISPEPTQLQVERYIPSTPTYPLAY